MNLLVIGASGGVANAFLHYLANYREYFSKLILIDKNDKILRDSYINHRKLDYVFIKKKIDIDFRENEYLRILRKYKIDIVLDITDMDSIPIIKSTAKTKVSYINTAINGEESVDEMLYQIFDEKKDFKNNISILCTGMNPGVVNMLARYGIEKYGKPEEIIHFEYDSSKSIQHFNPSVTWSIHEYLVESIRDPGGLMLGRRKVKRLFPNALSNKKNMKDILSRIMKMSVYPFGLPVLHEENVTLSEKYDIPSQFIYSLNIPTMNKIINIYSKKKNVTRKDLELANNTSHVLDGSDTIGLILKYKNKNIYYVNSEANNSIIGTSATYNQVITGIFAAIFSLIFGNIKKGLYFTEDLYEEYFKHFVFDNMRVSEYVFSKDKLLSFNPEIKLKKEKNFEHIYL